MKKVGIVGAGTMGAQIALVFADGGLETVLYDLTQDRLELGVKSIATLLDRQVGKGKRTTESRQAVLSGIRTSVSLSDMADADLVVEAVFEDMKTKQEIFGNLTESVNRKRYSRPTRPPSVSARSPRQQDAGTDASAPTS